MPQGPRPALPLGASQGLHLALRQKSAQGLISRPASLSLLSMGQRRNGCTPILIGSGLSCLGMVLCHPQVFHSSRSTAWPASGSGWPDSTRGASQKKVSLGGNTNHIVKVGKPLRSHNQAHQAAESHSQNITVSKRCWLGCGQGHGHGIPHWSSQQL